MKNLLPLFIFFSFTKLAIMQDVPSCVKSLNSKMQRAEKKFTALEEMRNQVGEYKFDIKFRALSTDVNNIVKYLEKSCNSEKVPDYDFSEVNAQVKDVVKRYNEWDAMVNGAAKNEEKIEKNKYKMRQFLSYINNFPRMTILSSDQEDYNASDTKQLLEIDDVKADFDDALSILNSRDIENNFYEIIDSRYTEYTNYKDDFILEAIRDHGASARFLADNVFNGNSSLIRMADYADNLLSDNDNQKSEALSKVAVSDYHINNVSTIRFTDNLSLDPTTATAADFKTEFRAGDHIKAIAYLADTYYNIYGEQNEPQFEVTNNNGLMDLAVENFKSGDQNKPYVEFYFSLNSSSYKPNPDVNPGTIRAMEYLTKLKPRTHRIEVQLDSYLGTAKIKGPESDVKGTF